MAVALSVIIPVLNEAQRIAACIERVAAQGFDEVIVVDGGSTDGTADIVRRTGATLVDAPRGRGQQLNAGARAASGDMLLFLHADVVLPDHAVSIARSTLARDGVVAGAFRTWTVDDAAAARWWAPLLHLADVRSRYSGIPYGDQAMFMHTDVFFAAGGFPDVALMEDIALSRRLRSFGRVLIARESVKVSGRRFLSAPIKQTLWVNLFPLLYAFGVSPRTLTRLYGDPR